MILSPDLGLCSQHSLFISHAKDHLSHHSVDELLLVCSVFFSLKYFKIMSRDREPTHVCS